MAHRWPDGVICPRCGGKNVLFQAKYNRWQCGSKHAFVSSPPRLEQSSKIPRSAWTSGLLAMWQVVNCKNGVSSLRNSPRYRRNAENRMVHGSPHPRCARHGTPDKLSGQVEADETFIGGKARNMHDGETRPQDHRHGGKDKTAVMGILERGKDGNQQGPYQVVRTARRAFRLKSASMSKLVPRSTRTP